MEQFIKVINKLFNKLCNKKIYVITVTRAGVKYYFIDAGWWTPISEGATIYKNKPDFDWIDNNKYIIEEY